MISPGNQTGFFFSIPHIWSGVPPQKSPPHPWPPKLEALGADEGSLDLRVTIRGWGIPVAIRIRQTVPGLDSVGIHPAPGILSPGLRFLIIEFSPGHEG